MYWIDHRVDIYQISEPPRQHYMIYALSEVLQRQVKLDIQQRGSNRPNAPEFPDRILTFCMKVSLGSLLLHYHALGSGEAHCKLF